MTDISSRFRTSAPQSAEGADPLQADAEAAPQAALLVSAPRTLGGGHDVFEEMRQRVVSGQRSGSAAVGGAPRLPLLHSAKHRPVCAQVAVLHRRLLRGDGKVADFILQKLLQTLRKRKQP